MTGKRTLTGGVSCKVPGGRASRQFRDLKQKEGGAGKSGQREGTTRASGEG